MFHHSKRKLNLAFVHDFLTNKECVDCGTKENLTFDHVRGIKVDNVSRMVNKGRSLVTIMEEIAKCDVRCWECHCARHEQERQTKSIPTCLNA